MKDEEESALREGSKIGDHTVVRLLGRGAMGEVWETEHRHLGRRSALKVLPSGLGADSAFRDRFAAEARTLARLEHPHIVRVLNASVDNGRFYLEMELLRPFHEVHPADKPMPPETVRHFLAQILEALAHAHREGIIHRDLKPANLLLTNNGSTLKVGDFGVACVIGADFERTVIERTLVGRTNSEAPTLVEARNAKGSGASSYFGTLQYMSPEVLAGREADARADLYALGVIAYEWLTGRKPVGRFKDPSCLKPGLSTAWDDWVNHLLEPEPDDRFADAGEAAVAIAAETVARRVPHEPVAEASPSEKKGPAAHPPGIPPTNVPNLNANASKAHAVPTADALASKGGTKTQIREDPDMAASTAFSADPPAALGTEEDLRRKRCHAAFQKQSTALGWAVAASFLLPGLGHALRGRPEAALWYSGVSLALVITFTPAAPLVLAVAVLDLIASQGKTGLSLPDQRDVNDRLH